MSGVRTGDGSFSIVAISVRDQAGDLQTVDTGELRDATGALKTFFSAMSATASPDTIRGYGNKSTSATIKTAEATVTVAGGVAPLTYLWERSDADPQVWTIVSPTTQSTSFSTALDEGSSSDVTVHCTVTDATGATAVSNDVSLGAINIGGGGLIVGEAP